MRDSSFLVFPGLSCCHQQLLCKEGSGIDSALSIHGRLCMEKVGTRAIAKPLNKRDLRKDLCSAPSHPADILMFKLPDFLPLHLHPRYI